MTNTTFHLYSTRCFKIIFSIIYYYLHLSLLFQAKLIKVNVLGGKDFSVTRLSVLI